MLTEPEALDLVLSRITPLPSERVPITTALGRFASETMLASLPLPGFDNSQVDGYALRAEDAALGTELPVTAEQPAGPDLQLELPPSSSIRIFTGAPIPRGANAVIMQEDVTRVGHSITINEPVISGENIRRLGSDLCAGQILMRSGHRHGPAHVGLLASQGIDQVPVHRLPTISILSTGDELIAPGLPLKSGQLYNSNGPMLVAMLANEGLHGATAHHCPDQLDATISCLSSLASVSDVIIISGGVSVGDHDHIKPALSAIGLEPELWRVKVKPGKPFLFVHRMEPRPLYVFGLPGNPVSAFVTFHLFVKPALLKLIGASDTTPATAPAVLTHKITNDGGRPHYVRGRWGRGQFYPTGLQQSHALFGLSQCNALLRVPEHTTLASGSACEVQLLH